MITKITKKWLIALSFVICHLSFSAALTSCSDMLEAESSRQLFDPTIDQKTDSVFYAYGIMQAMQQLADQYYFQNEMRGDLVRTTSKASTHLKSLASFSADATNKYDSVYLYYKVINNCNYYLAHRDSTLKTGLRNVVINEYAAVASFRAWTYLQLARQYGEAPYITEPVTTISQINANTTMSSWQTILQGEADQLAKLKHTYPEAMLTVPTFGLASNAVWSVGQLNWKSDRGDNIDKYIQPRRCFIPLNVVLGDLYLELGQYENAAICYFDYLRYVGQNSESFYNPSVNYALPMSKNYNLFSPIFKNLTEFPADFNMDQNDSYYKNTGSWLQSFMHDGLPGDVISYIPMAVNYTMGKTTEVPGAFGYDYYGSDNKGAVQLAAALGFGFDCPKTEDIQVVPSQAYCDSARRAQYYYVTELTKTNPQYWVSKSAPLGDARAAIVAQGMGADSSFVYTYKPSTAYIPLYRNTTVWLHLAEALNRMGYPDAAFAILKNGIHDDIKKYLHTEVYLKDVEGNDSLDADGNKILDTKNSHNDDKYYLTQRTLDLLTTGVLPFLNTENSLTFKNSSDKKYFVGIHFHGAGAVEDLYSAYRYEPVLKAKIDAMYADYGLGTPAYDERDYINAMEDLLCDEYAMEFAFEGTRYSDLRRLAIHKNLEGDFGGAFGDRWLSRKLQNNAAGITTQNCYLPYK